MKEKIKRFFLPSFNKKIFLVFFGLVIIASLFSPHFAMAAWWDWIVGAVTFVPYAAINILAQIAILITAAFATLAGGILDWVLSDSFCSLSYTNTGLKLGDPNFNPVIGVGFDITRSFVNMALVLILIFIAFSTILRISGYETKKLLVNLIIVALLVNFAPVICGLIVDAANIAMHYFTEHLTGLTNLVNLAKTSVDRVIPGWKILKTTEQIGQLAESSVLFIFNLLLIFILLMFAFLFIMRYIAIWILVILSPLAFVCYILPATKKIWDLWWNQLIQWSILGIAAGFFLYLGEQVSVELPKAIKISDELGNLSESGIFDDVLPHFVTLAFLFMGLVMALTTSATGAKQITLAVKKGGQKAGAAVSGFAAYRGKAWVRERVPESWRKYLQEQAKAPPPFQWGKGEKGWKGKLKRGMGTYARIAATPLWATRRGIGEAGLKLTEAEVSDINNASKRAEGSTPQRNLATIRTGTRAQKIGALKGALGKDQINDLRDLGFTNEELIETDTEALRIDPSSFKKMIAATPELAEEIRKAVPELAKQGKIDITDEDREKGIYNATTKVTAGIKGSEVHKLSKESFKNEEVKKAMATFWVGEQVGAAGREFGRAFIKDFQEMINAIEFKEPGWLEKNNPRLDTYLNKTAAGNLGFRAPTISKADKEEKEEHEKRIEGYKRDYEKNKELIDRIISAEPPPGTPSPEEEKS